MRERGTVDEVADRVDALDARAHRAVDLDQPALLELDAGLFEAQRADVGRATGGDHEPLDLAGVLAACVKVTLESFVSMFSTNVLVWIVMP